MFGVVKFNLMSKITKKSVVALGGIRKDNLNKLKMVNADGFSGITCSIRYMKNSLTQNDIQILVNNLNVKNFNFVITKANKYLKNFHMNLFCLIY